MITLKYEHQPLSILWITPDVCEIYHQGELFDEMPDINENGIVVPSKIVHDDPAEFLNMEAKDYPDKLMLSFKLKQRELDNTVSSVSFLRGDKIISIGFDIKFSSKTAFQFELNPIKFILQLFYEAENIGLRNSTKLLCDTSKIGGIIYYTVFANGNLADHYAAGLRTLAHLSDSVTKDMYKSIIINRYNSFTKTNVAEQQPIT